MVATSKTASGCKQHIAFHDTDKANVLTPHLNSQTQSAAECDRMHQRTDLRACLRQRFRSSLEINSRCVFGYILRPIRIFSRNTRGVKDYLRSSYLIFRAIPGSVKLGFSIIQMFSWQLLKGSGGFQVIQALSWIIFTTRSSYLFCRGIPGSVKLGFSIIQVCYWKF